MPAPERQPGDLLESRTYENLREAFASDAQAAARYSAFARRADQEGHLDLEEIFSALARGKTEHAHGALSFLRDTADPQTREPIKNSLEHLRSALARCLYENETLYPGFARTAREEGYDRAADWFETVAAASRRHTERLRRELRSLEQGEA
ncbi:MAG: rubrerythrin family protein [Planctomycetota bacterium]